VGPAVLTKENWTIGDAIGIYMKYGGKSFSEENVIVNNCRYLSTKNNVSTAIFVPATKEDAIYSPNFGSDFISYYPYKSEIKDYLYPIDISEQGGDPSKVDLLYATSNELSEKGDVSLSFKHQLSKLVLNLKRDLANKELNDVWPGLWVWANGFYTKANFSLIDQVISNRTTIQKVSAATTQDGMRVELILIPQTVGRSTYLNFDLAGNQLQWNIPEGKVFEAGKQYEYTVSIKMTWIEVIEGNIRPWVKESEFDIDGEESPDASYYGLTKITSGAYYIGSPEGEGEENEYPRHKVDLGGFWISSYEITNLQYVDFLNKTGVEFKSSTKKGVGLYENEKREKNEKEFINIIDGGKIKYDDSKADNNWVVVDSWDNYPVVNVSWHGAREFAKWLGGDLPTEAEWETACRAGRSGDFSFGNKNEAINSYKEYVNCEQIQGILPANNGLKPNAINLYNMHGNVQEWCLDAVGRDARGSSAPYDHKFEVAEMKYHPIRGGSWKVALDKCRSAYRSCLEPEVMDDDIGFRVVFPMSNVHNLKFEKLANFLQAPSLP
jgi:formylglycine-generating enzyme required for sulfatase activity